MKVTSFLPQSTPKITPTVTVIQNKQPSPEPVRIKKIEINKSSTAGMVKNLNEHSSQIGPQTNEILSFIRVVTEPTSLWVINSSS